MDSEGARKQLPTEQRVHIGVRTGQGAAAEDTELNERIDNSHQMLSNMKTAAAEEQRDLRALEDAESNVRIDVRTDDNAVGYVDSVVPLERNRGKNIREEIGPVTARKPVGREQPQQQDPAHGQEEQDQPQYRDVHSLAFDLLWWDGQSAAVKNGILKIQAIFRGNRCRALNKIAAQVTAHDHAVCGALCQEGCG